MNASVIVVGDEILCGHVRDANGHYIATKLAEHGHVLRSISIVSDAPADISHACSMSLSAQDIDLIFVCGGLGPTHDDRTMEGIAAALGVALEPCSIIAERIQSIATQANFANHATDPLGLGGLMKMALAPAGANALIGSSGVIPAFSIVARSKTIIVLPGPPRELQAVFHQIVEPEFLAGTGNTVVRAEIEHFFPESALASCLAQAERENGNVKIGSYPLEDRVLIRIAGSEQAVDAAAAFIRSAISDLSNSADGKKLLALMQRHHHQTS